jgi:hypothetical protein
VLRAYAGEDGALSLQASGWPGDPAPTQNPTWCLPAAFFDSLIAQQDRHSGNWRWDGNRLTLIDHGYAFALPGLILNHSDSLQPATAAAPLRCFRTSATRWAVCWVTRTCSVWRGSSFTIGPRRSPIGRGLCSLGTRFCDRASSDTATCAWAAVLAC